MSEPLAPATPATPGPYQAAAAPAIEPARVLAISAVALAAAFTFLHVVLAGVSLAYGRASEEIFDNVLFAAAAVLAVPVLLASYVVTCLWLYQARTNTAAMAGPDVHEYTSKWVWLGWWVPLVNLWIPHVVVRDVQKVSAHAAGQKPVDQRLWWGTWLVWLILSRVESRLDDVYPWLEVTIALLLVVALWRWALIVRSIVDAQTAVAQGVAAG